MRLLKNRIQQQFSARKPHQRFVWYGDGRGLRERLLDGILSPTITKWAVGLALVAAGVVFAPNEWKTKVVNFTEGILVLPGKDGKPVTLSLPSGASDAGKEAIKKLSQQCGVEFTEKQEKELNKAYNEALTACKNTTDIKIAEINSTDFENNRLYKTEEGFVFVFKNEVYLGGDVKEKLKGSTGYDTLANFKAALATAIQVDDTTEAVKKAATPSSTPSTTADTDDNSPSSTPKANNQPSKADSAEKAAEALPSSTSGASSQPPTTDSAEKAIKTKSIESIAEKLSGVFLRSNTPNKNLQLIGELLDHKGVESPVNAFTEGNEAEAWRIIHIAQQISVESRGAFGPKSLKGFKDLNSGQVEKINEKIKKGTKKSAEKVVKEPTKAPEADTIANNLPEPGKSDAVKQPDKQVQTETIKKSAEAQKADTPLKASTTASTPSNTAKPNKTTQTKDANSTEKTTTANDVSEQEHVDVDWSKAGPIEEGRADLLKENDIAKAIEALGQHGLSKGEALAFMHIISNIQKDNGLAYFYNPRTGETIYKKGGIPEEITDKLKQDKNFIAAFYGNEVIKIRNISGYIEGENGKGDKIKSSSKLADIDIKK